MRRAILAATLLAPAAAAAQTWNYVARDECRTTTPCNPVGLALPGTGVAVAEEPAAVAVNPAAAGFNRGFTLQYFHEKNPGSLGGDGIYAGLGPLSLTSEWLRPSDITHYRKLGVGLGIGDRVGSFGFSWNNWASGDDAIEGLHTFDVGLTVRPLRWLSLGAAALDLDGHVGNQWLPVRYQFGAATRLADDALTIWGDWLTDDAGSKSFRSRAVALGLAWETRFGVALRGQLQFPTQPEAGVAGATLFIASLAFNSRHAGVELGAGGTGTPSDRSTVFGVRLSTRGYIGFHGLARPVLVDLGEELDPPRSLLFGRPRDPLGALIRKLAQIREDPEAGAVVLRIERVPLAPGHADELRAAVVALREKKKVVAWIQDAGLREYALATAASRIEMAPPAVLQLTGISTTALYLRDSLAKLGIAFQAVATGKYKNAPDPLTRSDMSGPEREARESVLDELFGRQVRTVAEARGLSETRVRELVDQGFFSAAAAREAGLVDGISWPDELERALRAPSGFASSYAPPEPRLAQRWGPRPAVAVVRVAGTIVPGKNRGGPFDEALCGADTVVELVRRAAEDRDVAALVLRVDSPGGDPVASDLIWRSLVAARRRGKPVVVSMGDVAASGGYWIATAGEAIVAEPSTLTGSIGVFALKLDLSGLLGKIDARAVTLKRGARADVESVVRPWTEEEQKAIRKDLAAVQDTFVARVAESRHMTAEEVERVAQGRVWTGRQALERRLVDRLGSLSDAVALARERGGIAPTEEVEVRRFEPSRTFLEEMERGIAPGVTPALEQLLARSPEVRMAAVLMELGPVVALPLGWAEPLAASPSGAEP